MRKEEVTSLRINHESKFPIRESLLKFHLIVLARLSAKLSWRIYHRTCKWTSHPCWLKVEILSSSKGPRKIKIWTSMSTMSLLMKLMWYDRKQLLNGPFGENVLSTVLGGKSSHMFPWWVRHSVNNVSIHSDSLWLQFCFHLIVDR